MTKTLRRPVIALSAACAGLALASAAAAQEAAAPATSAAALVQTPADQTAAPAASVDPAPTGQVAAPASPDQQPPSAAPAVTATDSAVPAQASVAAPAEESSGWHLSAYPYLWVAAVNGTAAFKAPAPLTASATANFHIPFTDLISNLKFGFMGAAELRDDRFSMFTDALYLYVGFPGSTVHEFSGPLGHTVAITASGTMDIKAFVFTNAAGYDVVHSDNLTVSVFGGLRYLGVDAKLSWGITGPLGGVLGTGQAERYAPFMDGIAGVRGDIRLGGSRWKIDYYGDVGGGTNFTYQLLGQVAYSMKWGQVGLGWRYLDFQQRSSSPVPNLSMNGPILSAVYRF